MLLTRRGLLARASLAIASGATGIGFPRGAAADGGTTAAVLATISLAQSVASMMRKSGALEAEFAALNIKLDQLLANQALIVEAIGTVHQSLADLKKQVSAVSTDTVALLDVTRAHKLVSKTRAGFRRFLEVGVDDPQVRQQYADLRRELIDSAHQLHADAVELDKPPTLTIGAVHCLVGLRAFEHFDRNHGLGTNLDRKNMADAAREVEQTLLKLSASLPREVEAAKKRASNVERLLRKNQTFKGIFANAALRKDQSHPRPPGADKEHSDATLQEVAVDKCFAQPKPTSETTTVLIAERFNPRMPEIPQPGMNLVTTTEVIQMYDIKYAVRVFRTPASTPIIDITQGKPSKEYTWKRISERRDQSRRGDTRVTSEVGANPKKCAKHDRRKANWSLFAGHLSKFNAAASLEAYYEGLRLLAVAWHGSATRLRRELEATDA